MAEKLGIFVSSDKHLRHVIGITKAAEAAGKEVTIFFTAKGVLLTQAPEFQELMNLGKKSLCHFSYKAMGLEGKPAPGIEEKDFGSQVRHAEMIREVDRYIVM